MANRGRAAGHAASGHVGLGQQRQKEHVHDRQRRTVDGAQRGLRENKGCPDAWGRQERGEANGGPWQLCG
jgi:hypothetical protein